MCAWWYARFPFSKFTIIYQARKDAFERKICVQIWKGCSKHPSFGNVWCDLSLVHVSLGKCSKMSTELNIHLPLMRHFLRTSNCSCGFDVLRKACEDGEPGAVQILLLAIKIRANRRTRRTFGTVRSALQAANAPHKENDSWKFTIHSKLYAHVIAQFLWFTSGVFESFSSPGGWKCWPNSFTPCIGCLRACALH